MINVYIYFTRVALEVLRLCKDPVGYIIGAVLTASAIVAVINLIEQAKKDKEVKG